jgi:hypothetical protein
MTLLPPCPRMASGSPPSSTRCAGFARGLRPCLTAVARAACDVSGRDEETACFSRTKKHHRRHGKALLHNLTDTTKYRLFMAKPSDRRRTLALYLMASSVRWIRCLSLFQSHRQMAGKFVGITLIPQAICGTRAVMPGLAAQLRLKASDRPGIDPTVPGQNRTPKLYFPPAII